jgi:hypothetical protein
MRAALVLGCVSLVWLVCGLMMIAAPAWASGQVRRKLADPFARFLLLEGTALAGVLVALGGAVALRSWFWIAVGGLATAKALVLLGLSENACGRLCAWWCDRSPGLRRLAGAVAVLLATLLAIEALQTGGTN